MGLFLLLVSCFGILAHSIAAREEIPKSVQCFVEEMQNLFEPQDVCYLGFSKEEKKVLFQKALEQEDAFSSICGRGSLVAYGEEEEKEVSFSITTLPDSEKAFLKIRSTFSKAMRGRTMYVLPCVFGKLGAFAKPVLQITDSPFVALFMMTMAQTGREILPLFENGSYIKLNHCKGDLFSKEKRQESYLLAFLEKNEIWAFGKGVTIDQIRKELVFRLFSKVAYDEGWVVAHMPIFSLTDPEGRKRYGLMLIPESLSLFSLFQPALFSGWSLQLISSDSSWLFCKEGALMALNPEAGVFGRLLGPFSPSLRKDLFVDALFSEVPMTAEKALWWEKKESVIPWKLFDGKGKEWNRKKRNSFFASPSKSFLAEANLGVPISMIIVPTLKKSMYPLVCEGCSWEDGMLMMALLSSEKAKSSQGSLSVFDPFGMRDFCGVPLGEYIQKWFDLGDSLASENRCRFFTMNLAVQEALPRSLMPTLKWCFERCEERRETPVTAFGYIPAENAIDTTSIAPSSSYAELFQKDFKEWRKELLNLRLFLRKWEDSLPNELISQLLHSLNGRACDIPSNDQSFEDF